MGPLDKLEPGESFELDHTERLERWTVGVLDALLPYGPRWWSTIGIPHLVETGALYPIADEWLGRNTKVLGDLTAFLAQGDE